MIIPIGKIFNNIGFKIYLKILYVLGEIILSTLVSFSSLMVATHYLGIAVPQGQTFTPSYPLAVVFIIIFIPCASWSVYVCFKYLTFLYE